VGFEGAQSMHEIGLKLLQSVGVNEHDASDEMIAEALQANDEFIARLEAIRDSALGEFN
jgi:hypothetical protein